jgi:hypothetical protein
MQEEINTGTQMSLCRLLPLAISKWVKFLEELFSRIPLMKRTAQRKETIKEKPRIPVA